MNKQKITIPMSEEDLSELLHHEREFFDWSFPDQNDVWIEVRIERED